MDNNLKRVAVIGGGLVGGMNACLFAKRGFYVDLYELRQDIRKMDVARGRSINLALSRRGGDALAAIGIEGVVRETGIPMYARMIHDLDGTRRPIPYGKPDQCIMSIDRRKLNEVLVTEAEKFPNVRLHFEHKLKSCNFETGEITLEKNGEEMLETFDLIVGNDGAYSSVRREFNKATLFNISQEYIPHAYMELSIPANKNGEYAMELNYLHIWPRNEFMMIALPNGQDRTFVVTLFMPFDIFNGIRTKEDTLRFFETTFPDSLPLIGREALVQTFLSSKPLPLVMVKCSPYHVGDKGLIMGDAAHAMVPFYGQGMNCGLEDALVFDTLLEELNNNFSKALPAFTAARNEDDKAICDLAMYNYIEMRASVNSRMFLVRKKLDTWLHWLMPNTWVPLYTMVSFTRTPYTECIRQREWQDKVLGRIVSSACIVSVLGGSLVALKLTATRGQVVYDTVINTFGSWAKQLPSFQSRWSFLTYKN